MTTWLKPHGRVPPALQLNGARTMHTFYQQLMMLTDAENQNSCLTIISAFKTSHYGSHFLPAGGRRAPRRHLCLTADAHIHLGSTLRAAITVKAGVPEYQKSQWGQALLAQLDQSRINVSIKKLMGTSRLQSPTCPYVPVSLQSRAISQAVYWGLSFSHHRKHNAVILFSFFYLAKNRLKDFRKWTNHYIDMVLQRLK